MTEMNKETQTMSLWSRVANRIKTIERAAVNLRQEIINAIESCESRKKGIMAECIDQIRGLKDEKLRLLRSLRDIWSRKSTD